MSGAADMRPATGAGPRILLVEDEPANRALVRAIVARVGQTSLPGTALSEAGSLAEARALLEAETFDIVLLDVRLPDGSGIELARELREARGPGTPQTGPRVVIVSASVLAQERADALAVADEFLPKPFVTFDLIDLIARLTAGI